MDVERVVLTPSEAAAMLGVSTRTLRTLKQQGRIAWVPFGPHGVGYRSEDVIACRDAAVRRNAQAAPRRAPKPISGKQPDWLARNIAEGRINPLTRKPFGVAS